MGAIAVRLSPRARLTRPLFATAPQYSDGLLGVKVLPFFGEFMSQRREVKRGTEFWASSWKGCPVTALTENFNGISETRRGRDEPGLLSADSGV